MCCNRGVKGSTLIELLIAFALLSVVMVCLLTVYFTANNAWQAQVAATDSQYMARSAMQWVINDIRPAKTAALENNNLIIIKSDGQKVVYKVDTKKQLQRNNSPIAENITSADYRIHSDLIEVTITATVNDRTYILTSAATPRSGE